MTGAQSGRILASVLVALTALVLLAPRSTPRGAQATPSSVTTIPVGGTLSSDPALPEAPTPPGAGASPTPAGSPPPVGVTPTALTIEPATARNPRLTPPPEGITGDATYYAYHPGQAAAAAALRAYLGPNWRGMTVTVATDDRAIRVVLTDYESSTIPGRLIDLDAGDFALLAPLSRGVVQVTVTP